LAWREERTVTRNLTLRYDRMMLLLDPTRLAGKKVEVVNYPDGRFAVRHEGVALPFRVFDKIQTVAPGAIVENKRLGEALAFARELQASYPPKRRGAIHDASGRQTTWRRRVCRRRAGHHATLLSRRRPEANQIDARSSPLVFRYVTELSSHLGRAMRRGKGWVFKGSGDLPR
jgi:hypothetical protein